MLNIVKTFSGTNHWEHEKALIDKNLYCLANIYRRTFKDSKKLRKLNGVTSLIIRKNGRGAGFFNFEIEDIIGVGTLVLGGICQKVEDRYCFKFQSDKLCVPVLEFSRPLIYHVIYKLTDNDKKFNEVLDRVLHVANAFSLGFLISCCPNKFKLDDAHRKETT